MAEEKKEKMVIIATHGAEDPERATLPFVVGNAAVAMEVGVTVVLQGTAVILAKKGCYEHVFASGFDPLKKLVDSFLELGGEIFICIPCIEVRHITPEMMIDGVKLVKAGKVVQSCLEANAVLNY
jgi:predicted peroxiredoxin